jgi:hypothetical protein
MGTVGAVMGSIGLAAVIPAAEPIAGVVGIATLVSWLYHIRGAATRNWHINKATSHKKIAIIFGDMRTTGDCLGWWYGAGANLGLAFQGVSVYGFGQALKDAGYKDVTLKYNPNENEFAELCNQNDIVVVLAHGPGDFGIPEIYDSKNKPLAGFYLGGNSSHIEDRFHSDFTANGLISDRWITANEIEGKITNQNLTFVAASCYSSITNRMGTALANTTSYPTGFYYVGHTQSIFSAETEALFQYVVDTLNIDHTYAEKNLPSSKYKVNPTNASFH